MGIRSLRKERASLFQCTLIAACFAVLIGTLWVLSYLQSIQYSASVFDLVTGDVTQFPQVFTDTRIFFVAIMRFILGFGLTWMPLSLLFWGIQALFNALRT